MVKPDLHRPARRGNISLTTTLRITPEVRDRIEQESRIRNLTSSGLIAILVEAIVDDNLFKAVLDDGVSEQ